MTWLGTAQRGRHVVTLGPQIRPQEANAAAEGSFEAYVTARGAALVRFAMLLTGDDHRAEDLVQDALTKAYLRWSKIRRADNPDVYLRQLVINGSRSWWRRRTNRETPGLQPARLPAERAAPGDLGDEAVARDELWRLIVALPDQQRAVIVLRYYEDLDDVTIAQILECTPVTVRTHAMRALRKLRGHLGEAGNE